MRKFLADCEVNIFANENTENKTYNFSFTLDNYGELRSKMVDELNKYIKSLDGIVKPYQIKSVTVNIDVYTADKKNFIYCDNSIFLKYDNKTNSFAVINEIGFVA